MSDYIVVRLEEESYAIPVSETQEIIKLQPLTKVPGVSPYINGIINLRGKIVPVVGLRERFRMSARQSDARSRIVIVNTKEEAVGLLVDSVVRVTALDEILPPPEGLGSTERAWFAGVAKRADGLISVLDLQRVLHDGGTDR